MGKKKAKKRKAGDVNKSLAIRDYLGKYPKAGPKQIVEALREQGIKVSVGLAGVVKYTAGGKKKAGKKVARKKVAIAGRGGGLSADDLLKAKQVVDQLGGIEQARQALETLERLR